MIRRILCLGLLVLAIAAAPASAQYGVLGEVDDNIVTGGGCPPGSTVTFTLQTTGGQQVAVLGSTTADANGNFRFEVDPSGIPNGNYNLVISCGGFSTTIPVVVSDSGLVAPIDDDDDDDGVGPGVDDDGLARTGSDSTTLIRGAAVLIAAGGLLLIASRRRGIRTA